MARAAESADEIVYDDPGNRCFGCSPHNPRGLGLRFRRLPEGAGVEAEVRAHADLCGAPGVIHGGLQATMLDEVLGVAAHQALHTAEGEAFAPLVTADFRLRYRRPAPTEAPLLLYGRVVRTEGREVWLEGELVADDGTVLTRAEARWVRVAPRA